MTATEARPFTPAEAEAERLRRKREAALGYRIFAALRWGDLGDGHITARDPIFPDHFWMLRYHVPFERATVDDMVLVAPDGSVADGGRVPADEAIINRAGYLIHHPIHAARPDVVSAAHVHTPWGTPFSAERRLFDSITQESCIFVDDIALFDDEEVQVQTQEGGQRIAEAIGQHRTVILANHGLLATGGSVAETIAVFVEMERVAEAHMKVRNATPISRDAALYAKSDLVNRVGFESSFGYLVARHVGDPTVVG